MRGESVSVFASPSEVPDPGKKWGNVYNGTYHMPLLPGEEGPKGGGDWVPYGVTRMTNVVGALEDTRALSIWEQALTIAGLVMDPELFDEAQNVVLTALGEGVDFELLREHPELKERLAGRAWGRDSQEKTESSIAGRAKKAAGGSRAAEKGTARHKAWEVWDATGKLTGDAPAQVLATERLLKENGLERVPGLSERVVRNVVLGNGGRFDNVVREVATGRLLMADLKSKATRFFSYLTVDAQMAGYSRAEHLLEESTGTYSKGPIHFVDQEEGVILHVPSDGSAASLEPVDLVHGWEVALMARRIYDLRAYGRSAARMRRQWGRPGASPTPAAQG